MERNKCHINMLPYKHKSQYTWPCLIQGLFCDKSDILWYFNLLTFLFYSRKNKIKKLNHSNVTIVLGLKRNLFITNTDIRGFLRSDKGILDMLPIEWQASIYYSVWWYSALCWFPKTLNLLYIHCIYITEIISLLVYTKIVYKYKANLAMQCMCYNNHSINYLIDHQSLSFMQCGIDKTFPRA
jgi:hypothetical protein